MGRPLEEATLDPWADVVAAGEARALALANAEIERENKILEHKLEQRKNIWVGVGWICGLAVVGAVIVGIALAITASIQGGRDDRFRQLEVRQEMIATCASVDDPVERQLCYIATTIEELNEPSGSED